MWQFRQIGPVSGSVYSEVGVGRFPNLAVSPAVGAQRRTGDRERKVNVPKAFNGTTAIHYRTHGDPTRGETMVFLTGAGADGALWQPQMEALEEVCFSIAIDNRGSGQSDGPEGPYSATMMAADVLSVLDTEGVSAITLVGFSLGGLIAQKFVSLYPRRVRRLALFNCSLGAGNPNTVLPKAEVINMFLFFAALTEADCCRNAMDYNFGPDFETVDPERYRAFFDYTLENSRGMPGQIPVLVSTEAFISDFAAITQPVLVVMSKDDPVTPPENGEGFRRLLPRARIEYLDGHHASMLIHPNAVSSLLGDFLANG